MSTKPTTPTGTAPAPTVRKLLQTIKEADVVYLAFPRLQQALIVDLRQTAIASPTMLRTKHQHLIEVQVATIRAALPAFTSSVRFASVSWGGSTRAFAEQGVLPAILNRLPKHDTREAMRIIEQLRDVERGTNQRATDDPERSEG